MTAVVRGADLRTALPVEGTLPDGLDGCFLQAGPHPAVAVLAGGRLAAAGPHIFTGIRLDRDGARWHRARMPVSRSELLGPVPALAPSAWLVDSDPALSDRLGHASVARPVSEAGSPEWHTVATYPGLDYAEYLVAGPDGTVVRAEPFPLEGAPIMHAVALTRRFVVVLDLPVVFSRAAALVGERLPYVWRPDRPARIGLLPRQDQGTAEARWFPIDPCYVFHVVNAFDDGDQVVMDAAWNASAFGADPKGSGTPHLRRWTLDLATGGVSARMLVQGLNAAVVDERVSGRGHRYIFGSSGRYDLVAGTVRTGPLGPGWRAGHPRFVPDQRRAGEGNGWIVFVAGHLSRRECELRVVDARDPAGPPRAVVRLPVELPLDRRVAWVPDGQPGVPAGAA